VCVRVSVRMIMPMFVFSLCLKNFPRQIFFPMRVDVDFGR